MQVNDFMRIEISGQHNFDNALQAYVREKLMDIVQKYFGDFKLANVNFANESTMFSCEIELIDNSGQHISVKNRHSFSEIYHSFDDVMLSLEKQLRRYKSMQIAISGQHINIGESLQAYVREKLIHIVEKYFGHFILANVHFTSESKMILCSIELTDSSGKHIIVKNQHLSNEVYHSFDNTMLNLEKQLRRYKSKLLDRHDRVKISKILPSTSMKYVLDHNIAEEDDSEDNNPVIIAEKPVEIEDLTVSEAVMVMDLKNLPAMIFRNSKNGRTNIVYYRKDGNISWIDSK